jgi:hypothetical protein
MIHKIKTKTSVLKRFFWFYSITILVVLIFIFLLILHRNEYAVVDTLVFFRDVIDNILTSPLLYIISLIPYLLFLLIKSLVRNYKQYKVKGLLKGIFLKIGLPVAIIFIGNKALQNYRLSEVVNYTWNTKIENNLAKVNNYDSIDNK